MSMLQGIVPIVAAPFYENGDVDYGSLKNLIGHLVRIGCDGLTLFGIAGEYYKLSDDEQGKMMEVMIGECRSLNAPSVVSITQHSTYSAIERAKYAEALGADYLMLLPPFFLKPSGDELYSHMKSVCRSVKIPVIVQYAPEQTGVGIAPGVFRRLTCEAENAEYYKIECKPAGPYISDFLSQIENKARVFVGNAGYQMIEAFDRGAVGAMPGCSLSEIYIKIYRAYTQGRRDEAVLLHNRLLPLLNHIRQNVEMIIHFEKKILAVRGIIESEYCRGPEFTSDEEMDRLFFMYYDQIKDLLL